MKLVSATEAAKIVQSGQTVFLHSVAAAPRLLIEALTARANELRGVNLISIHTEGPAPYAAPELKESFTTISLFVGANLRQAVASGEADYVPVFLSEVPSLFRKGIFPIDVAFLNVSPPDRHGFCTLGVSVDVSRAAVQSARLVVAQINPMVPRTHGEGLLHVSEIDFGVEVEEPLYESHPRVVGPVEEAIGKHCAALVEDGATIQMGIGAIPDAVLAALGNHRDLGVHTEMFAEGVIPLVEKGVITGAKKKIHPGKIVASFLMGTEKLYSFVDDNPLVMMAETSFVNDTHIIRQNPKVTAINSAIEVDITGQVVADSIGTRHYSGIGGQMDFMRGAGLSEGGKPIIALPSTTRRGESRITAVLKPGGGVVTTRAHVQYVVTEYGVAPLYGKTLRQRARALIDIAHPDHREHLEEQAFARFRVLP